MESTGDWKTKETHLSEYFAEAQARFELLTQLDELDQRIESDPSLALEFELALTYALRSALAALPAIICITYSCNAFSIA